MVNELPDPDQQLTQLLQHWSPDLTGTLLFVVDGEKPDIYRCRCGIIAERQIRVGEAAECLVVLWCERHAMFEGVYRFLGSFTFEVKCSCLVKYLRRTFSQ